MKKVLCFFTTLVLLGSTSFHLVAFALDSGFRNPVNVATIINPNYPGVSRSGLGYFAGITNISSSNDAYITATLPNPESRSNYLRVTNYGFTIPSGAVIDGIELLIERSEAGSGSATIQDYVVQLSKNNLPVGDNKAQATARPTSDEVAVYGGPTDLWGSTRTAEEINNTKFGMFFLIARSAGTLEQAKIDQISIKVYYTETVPPVPNPALSQACGLDIAFVIDRSGSIDNTEMNQLKGALTSFTNAFVGTPTAFSLTTFDTTATVQNNFSLTPAQAAAAINALGGQGVGETNWKDGLLKGFSTFDPRPSKPNLIIFASDGHPTEPGSDADALAAAIAQADLIKNAGVRILTIGVSLDADGINKLSLISGPNVDAGGLGVDVITSSFATLASDFAVLAQQLCGGTITVSTFLENTTTPGEAGTQITVAGNTQTTDANGQTNAVDVAPGTHAITSTIAPEGYEFSSATCRNQDNQIIGTSSIDGRENIMVDGDDIISCDIIYSVLPVEEEEEEIIDEECTENCEVVEEEIEEECTVDCEEEVVEDDEECTIDCENEEEEQEEQADPEINTPTQNDDQEEGAVSSISSSTIAPTRNTPDTPARLLQTGNDEPEIAVAKPRSLQPFEFEPVVLPIILPEQLAETGATLMPHRSTTGLWIALIGLIGMVCVGASAVVSNE